MAITANQRLCIYWQRELAQYQLEQGITTWATPKIIPLNLWLAEQYQMRADSAIILSASQESLIWQQIIEADDTLDEVNMPVDSAHLAKQAWQLMHYWNVALTQLHDSHIPEVDAFLRWALQFISQSKKNGFISEAQLPLQLMEQDQDLPPKPKSILLMGFDELPPIIESLFSKMECEITHINPHLESQSVVTVGVTDQQDEITAMARWAKARLDNHPQQKIACIVPDLNHCHHSIQACFNAILCPENSLLGQQKQPLPFNISASHPLSHFPLINGALNALQLKPNRISLDALSHLLTSPYFCQETIDIDAGAQIDYHCHELNESTLTLTALLDQISEVAQHHPTQTWLDRFRQWQSAFSTLPSKALPSQWSHYFTQLLQSLHWPGCYTLSSHEYQLQQQWYHLLDTFNQLDLVCRPMPYDSALATLHHLAKNTPFHTEGSDMPIQILGVLESGGLEFDAMWVMGLHQDVWPASAKPNPFLPHQLQRALHMPHADMERELAYTKKTMQRFLRSATHMVFSYPEQSGDKHLSPSPLLAAYQNVSLDSLVLSPSVNAFAHFQQPTTLEEWVDTQAPPVRTEEAIHGGSFILQQQALCPFRAFSECRLQAHGINRTQLGIDNAQRGTLLHEALALLWENIHTHHQLCQLSDEEQASQINQALKRTLEKCKSKQHTALNQALLDLEYPRLHKIIQNWLNIEKKRAPFQVIARESRHPIQINQLSLRIQIDRVDKLSDGSFFIIDYKTGLTQPNHWFSDPLIEPQLPLYCIYGGDKLNATPIIGMAFAELRSNQIQIKGVISEQHSHSFSEADPQKHIAVVNIEDYEQSWQESIDTWKQQLQQLTQDFMQGHAAVAPSSIKACLYCDLQPLCRIHHE